MTDSSLLFIALSVIILIIIVTLLVISSKKRTEQQISHLTLAGMILVILGIVFGTDRLVGYSFIGAGVLLAVYDAMKNRKKK